MSEIIVPKDEYTDAVDRVMKAERLEQAVAAAERALFEAVGEFKCTTFNASEPMCDPAIDSVVRRAIALRDAHREAGR